MNESTYKYRGAQGAGNTGCSVGIARVFVEGLILVIAKISCVLVVVVKRGSAVF